MIWNETLLNNTYIFGGWKWRCSQFRTEWWKYKKWLYCSCLDLDNVKAKHKPSTQLCILLILFLWFSCQGTIEFNLNNMPMPAKKSSSCDLKMLPDINMGTSAVKTVSLFEQKRLRGFWPVFDEKDGVRQLTVSTSLYFLFFEILSV